VLAFHLGVLLMHVKLEVPEDKLKQLSDRYGWDRNKAIKKIREAQRVRPRLAMFSEGVADFLLGIGEKSQLLCDGCNVRHPHEHRCLGIQAKFADEKTGQRCHCADCFVVRELGLS